MHESASKQHKAFPISAKTKNSNFSWSNSNFSILTPTFSRDGFYESYFQNPSESSAVFKILVRALVNNDGWKITNDNNADESFGGNGIHQ